MSLYDQTINWLHYEDDPQSDPYYDWWWEAPVDSESTSPGYWATDLEDESSITSATQAESFMNYDIKHIDSPGYWATDLEDKEGGPMAEETTEKSTFSKIIEGLLAGAKAVAGRKTRTRISGRPSRAIPPKSRERAITQRERNVNNAARVVMAAALQTFDSPKGIAAPKMPKSVRTSSFGTPKITITSRMT